MYQLITSIIISLCCISCNHQTDKNGGNSISMAKNVAAVPDSIRQMLSSIDPKSGQFEANNRLYACGVLQFYYPTADYMPMWSANGKWTPVTDSLMDYLGHCATDGLFSGDYQYKTLQSIKLELDNDSLAREKPEKWARADLYMTDALVHLMQDLKQGRLQADSLLWKYDGAKQAQFFKPTLDEIKNGRSFHQTLTSLQPSMAQYWALKKGIPAFLSRMDKQHYTYLFFPFLDSLAFRKILLERLSQTGLFPATDSFFDTASIRHSVSHYQRLKGLKPTGKLSAALVDSLNNTDEVAFKRIAITLDRYKRWTDPLPQAYVWINLPAYHLQVWENDSIALQSKVIIGKPNTPSPEISSEIYEIITYPTWTVPHSIIRKEIIPIIRKNPHYLYQKNMNIYDKRGDLIAPYSINWFLYQKDFPYEIVQKSGDDNALGIIKFNFLNPFSVYLHDTNQRSLFGKNRRCLSHGCIRLQDWMGLLYFIIKYNNLHLQAQDRRYLSTETITEWLAQKENHRIRVYEKLPIFVGYYGCEGVAGKIQLYEDIYMKDKMMLEKYFLSK